MPPSSRIHGQPYFILPSNLLMAVIAVVLLLTPALCAEDEDSDANVEIAKEWTIFAPVDPTPLPLENELLKSEPKEITVAGQKVTAKRVTPKDNQFDLRPFFGPPPECLGKVAYLYIPVESSEKGTFDFGFGADWYLQAWMNGDLILDTTKTGNKVLPPSIRDNQVSVPLKKGKNLLAIRFISGKNSSLIALGGPTELGAAESGKPSGGGAMAAKYPADESSLKPTQGWAPQFLKAVPQQGRIPLKVDWGTNRADAGKSPVTFGVPFPKGALQNPRHVRLVDHHHQPVPAQITKTATWDGRNGSVRWLLVHAIVEKGRSYSLEYGSEVDDTTPAALSVEDKPNEIIVQNGAVRTIISKDTSTLVSSVALDGNGDGKFSPDEVIVTAEESAKCLPQVTDDKGVVYSAAGGTGDLKVELKESGPMRAVIRREGWYADSNKSRFCKFVTYTYFRSGQPGFRHDHTLIAGFDTQKHQIRDIALALPLKLAGKSVASFARDENPETPLLEFPAGAESLSLVQNAHNHWQLNRAGQPLAEGVHSGGWFGLADDRWGAYAGITDFWQQYPAELEVKKDRLVLHLWPAHDGPPLSFQPSASMGANYPGKKIFYSQWYGKGLDEMTQGFGVGKTHNITVNFYERKKATETAALTHSLVNQPVLVLAEPDWNCASEAFGRVHPYDPEHFPQIEKLLDALVFRQHWLRDKMENYGWIHFGDINYRLTDSTNPEKIGFTPWRHWSSMFYGFPNVMPTLYLRSGRRELWDFHRSNTKHITDIDICHLDSRPFGKSKGQRYGGIGGIHHYAGPHNFLDCDTHLRFMLDDYYLNGNLRTWEVANDYLDAYLATRDLSANTRYNKRHTGGALRLFTEGYQATWKPEYLSAARQFMDIMIRVRETGKELDHIHDYSDVYTNEGKLLYYQLTGDTAARQLFLNDMEFLRKKMDAHLFESRAVTMAGPVQAYWLTGDKDFLSFPLWLVDRALERIPVDGPDYQVGAGSKDIETIDVATLGHQLPLAMAALAEEKELPEPIGPATGRLKTAGTIYLNPPRGENSIQVDCSVEAFTKPSWTKWANALPDADKPAVLLVAADGSERARLPVNKSSNLIDIHFPKEGENTGTYTLRLHSPALPALLALIQNNKSTTQAVLPADGQSRMSAESLAFLVPKGTARFKISLKPTTSPNGSRIVRDQVVRVINATGQEVSKVAMQGGRNRWTVIQLNAEAPASDEFWKIAISPIVNDPNEEFFLKLQGVPPYVALSSKQWFLPKVASTATPAQTARFPGEGNAVSVSEKSALQITNQTEGKPILSPSKGALEFWLNTRQPHNDTSAQLIAKCGWLQLYRVGELGTTLSFGPGVPTNFQMIAKRARFVIPRDRWVHLKIEWKTNPSGDLDAALCADGVEIQKSTFKVDKGWPGSTLAVYGQPGDSLVGDIRLSEKGATSDGQTAIRFTEDGSPQVQGQSVTARVEKR